MFSTNLEEKIKGLLKKPVLITAIIALLLPAVFLFVMIFQHAVNTPFQDEWELVPLIHKVDNGSVTLTDFWDLHNQHRMFFPKLVMVTEAYLTHWNLGIMMLLTWSLAVACFAFLVILIKNYVKTSKYNLFLILVFASVINFSLTQEQNWLTGWQIQWLMCNAAFLGSLVMLSSKLKYARTIAVILAIIATLSLASGQFVWVAGLFILLTSKRSIKYWVVAGIATMTAYYIGYQPDGYQTPISYSFEHPFITLKFFLAYLGRPLSPDLNSATWLGLGGVVILLVLLAHRLLIGKRHIRAELSRMSLPIVLICYAIFNAITTTASRSGLGIMQSLTSRYITMSNLFWIGFILVIFYTVTNYKNINVTKITQRKSLILNNITLVMIFVALLSSYNAAKDFTAEYNLRQAIKVCTHAKQPKDECLAQTYPVPQRIHERLDYLKHKGWAGY